MTLNKLFKIILDRKQNPIKESYVSNLFEEGIDRIAQKVGEEGVEVVIAAKNSDKDLFLGEVADLWFHSLILIAEKGFTPTEVLRILEDRHNK